MATMKDKLHQIEETRERLKLGGGLAEIKKQHDKGKLTARERINRLLDSDSFQEVDPWYGAFKTGFSIDEMEIPGDAVVVGSGEVNGRPIYVWAQDATLLGGRMAEVHTRKIVMVMERALRNRVPIVGIYDSEGIRADNEVNWHGHFTLGLMTKFQTISSGVIPQISLVMGPCLGGAALSAALSDFVSMVKNTSYMHVAPPSKEIKGEELGSAVMHSRTSGCCHVLAENDEDCLAKCREWLGFLPQNNSQRPPVVDTGDPWDRADEELLDIVPMESYKWFDMRQVIKRIVDKEYYFEIQKDYAQNLTIGLARLEGQTVGVIANNSMSKAGCFDVDSADKYARFVRFCDAFNIPLIHLTDSPAFMPSTEQERRGILRHGTMTIHATSEATVPKITVYVRKCYGGAQLVMPSNLTEGDRDVAWPSVERGAMGAEEMVSFLYKSFIASAPTPEEAEKRKSWAVRRMEGTIDYFTRRTNEDIIDPRQTRPFLVKALRCLADKKGERPWRKHENINL